MKSAGTTRITDSMLSSFCSASGKSSSSKRVLIESPLYSRACDEKVVSWSLSGKWPCRWIDCETQGEAPFVIAYRHDFHLAEPRKIRIHVTADERYLLYLDGKKIGRGSERGEPNHWFFETYDLSLSAGDHLITALVCSQGKKRAFAQMSVSPGFFLSPQDEFFQTLIGTGLAPWKAKRMEGYTFTDPMAAWGTGLNLIVDGRHFDWDVSSPKAEGWEPARVGAWGLSAHGYAEVLEGQHLLLPAVLPPMMEEERQIGEVRHLARLDPGKAPVETAAVPVLQADHQRSEAAVWQKLFSEGRALTIPPRTAWRAIVDLDDYYCAYPRVVVSGGRDSTVRINWQEALLEAPDSTNKGNRNEIEGKYFATLWWKCDGVGDSFILDGGKERIYEPLWWQAGRYVEIVVVTGEEELTIERLTFIETRYPMKNESVIKTSREDLNALVPILTRSLHACSHETYVDCPYYEQLCYAGDSRLDALMTYVTTADPRLPRKTLQLFDWSRIQSGLTQSRSPSRVRQIIPPFSLWWICMVHDHARWRGDKAFVRECMPGVRSVLEAYRKFEREEGGTVSGVPGWNFVDWVSWEGKDSDGGDFIANGTINWQLVLAAQYAAQLEDWLGEPELARRQRQWAARLVDGIRKKYWNEERKFYAENASQTVFGSHAQALALISGCVPQKDRKRLAEALMHDRSLIQPTLYFRHYIFEALQSQGFAGRLPALLGLWLDMPGLGFKTTYETHPATTRSDCHSWGAHPLYHYFATLAGIRPAAFGFDEIVVRPALDQPGWIEGEMPHPRGTIRFRFEQEDDRLSGHLALPPGTSATVHFAGSQVRVIGSSQVDLRRRLESQMDSLRSALALAGDSTVQGK